MLMCPAYSGVLCVLCVLLVPHLVGESRVSRARETGRLFLLSED